MDDHLRWARALQAIAQSGLTYARDPAYAGDVFDVDRYEQVLAVATEMFATLGGVPPATIAPLFDDQVGYATPKLDGRGLVFDADGRVLLVRERLDGDRWTVPGGWVDVNESPAEAVTREVLEETGYEVVAERVLALWDRDRHDHPPGPFHCWKVMVGCRIVGGAPQASIETSEPRFWSVDDLPELSRARITAAQLQRLRALHLDRGAPTAFD